MKQLRQVGRFFRRNFDVCIQIAIILGLAIAGAAGVATLQNVFAGTLAIFTMIAVSIFRNRQVDEAIDETLKRLAPKDVSFKNRAYSWQLDADADIEAYIKNTPVREAVLIQYSCTTSMGVLRALLRKGAKVAVYIQDEKTSEAIGSNEQASRVRRTCEFLKGDLGDLFDEGRLKLRKYNAPCTVSAIKIDDHLLAMGWYTYEHVEDDKRSKAHPEDSVQISGHDVATYVAWKGTAEFDALDATFTMLEKNYQRNSKEVPL